MKPGTLVNHYRWGKGIALEVKGPERFPTVSVRWLKPITHPSGTETTTSSVYITELTTISAGE